MPFDMDNSLFLFQIETCFSNMSTLKQSKSVESCPKSILRKLLSLAYFIDKLKVAFKLVAEVSKIRNNHAIA